jgi:cell division transport system permease protein
MKPWLRHHAQSLGHTVRRLASSPLATGLNILVIGIALALPLGGYVLLINMQHLLRGLPVDEQISLFLDPAAQRQQARELEQRLRSQPGVSDVRFVSKEAALSHLRRTMELDEVLAALRQNPLPDALIVRLSGSDPAISAQIAGAARSLPIVTHVQTDSTWARRLKAAVDLGRTAVGLLVVLLGLALVAVIFNTIRLQILTHHAEIEVARLVGATDAYIRRPFFYLGALQGVLGALLAVGIVAGSLTLLNRDVTVLSGLYGNPWRLAPLAWYDGLALVGFAGMLGWLGAFLSVSRHLHVLDPT